MKINWKKVIGWGAAALVVISVVGTNMYNQQKEQSNNKKNVYAVLPLTGFASHVGQTEKKTLELWKELHPDYSFNLKIIDSESTPSKALSALQQALLNEENPVIITSNSMFSYNFIPLVEERKGFEFMIVTFEKQNFQNNYFLRMSEKNTDSLTPVIDYAKRYKDIYAFYTNEEFGKNSVNFLSELLSKQGQTLTDSIPIETTQRDLRIEALKAINGKADAVFVLGFGCIGYSNIIRELQEQGFTGDILTGTATADPAVFSLIDTQNGRVIFPDKDMPMNDGKHSAIIDALQQKLNARPFYVSFETWDTLDLIDWTIKNNKPFSQKTYSDLGKWKGVAGDIKFGNDGNVGYQFHLATFKNGKIVPVEE